MGQFRCPEINVLGHNVLQYLFEYALDKNELAPSLGISRDWIDETILEIKLRQGVRFHNGEPFDAHAVKFNFEYQRQHNPGRGVQYYMSNWSPKVYGEGGLGEVPQETDWDWAIHG